MYALAYIEDEPKPDRISLLMLSRWVCIVQSFCGMVNICQPSFGGKWRPHSNCWPCRHWGKFPFKILMTNILTSVDTEANVFDFSSYTQEHILCLIFVHLCVYWCWNLWCCTFIIKHLLTLKDQTIEVYIPAVLCMARCRN